MSEDRLSLRNSWNRLQEIVQNDYEGCGNLRSAMNDVAAAIAAEITLKHVPAQKAVRDEALDRKGMFGELGRAVSYIEDILLAPTNALRSEAIQFVSDMRVKYKQPVELRALKNWPIYSERPPSGEMVMVPRELPAVAQKMAEAVRWIIRDAAYKAPEQIGDIADRWITRLREVEEFAGAVLSAAEVEGGSK